MAHAAEVYARRARLGADVIQYAHEIQFDALRLLGQFLLAAPKNVGMKGSVVTPTGRVGVKDDTPTLDEQHISWKESARSQFLATLPEVDFELVRSGTAALRVRTFGGGRPP